MALPSPPSHCDLKPHKSAGPVGWKSWSPKRKLPNLDCPPGAGERTFRPVESEIPSFVKYIHTQFKLDTNCKRDLHNVGVAEKWHFTVLRRKKKPSENRIHGGKCRASSAWLDQSILHNHSPNYTLWMSFKWHWSLEEGTLKEGKVFGTATPCKREQGVWRIRRNGSCHFKALWSTYHSWLVAQ